MKKKSRDEVAEDLKRSRSVTPYIRHVGLSGDWSVSAWTMPGDKFLVDEEDADGNWSIVRRYYVDDDYVGIPTAAAHEADGFNDVLIVFDTLTFDEAVDLVFRSQ